MNEKTMVPGSEKEELYGHDIENGHDGKGRRSSLRNSLGGVVAGEDMNAIEGQLYSMNDIDPVLDAKMRLVNRVSSLSRNRSCATVNNYDRLLTRLAGHLST